MSTDSVATYPRLWTKVRWTTLGLVALWAVNGVLLAVTLAAFFLADVGVDWAIYVEAGQRFYTGGLYEWDGLPWRYSPVLAPFFALIAPIGYIGWSALHFGALFLLPYRLGMIALVMAPFWNDVYNGNTMSFVAVAAVLALQGSRWGTFAYLALCLLIPRPVMLPVLAYILWTRREYVLPFAVMFVIHALAVWATGWGPEWIAHLAGSGQDIYSGADLGPARFLGLWCWPVGLAIAAYLTYRGRLGWASVFASPYWLLHYGMMLLLEFRSTEAQPVEGRFAPEREKQN